MRTSTFTPDQKKIQIAEMLNNYYTVKEIIKKLNVRSSVIMRVQNHNNLYGIEHFSRVKKPTRTSIFLPIHKQYLENTQLFDDLKRFNKLDIKHKLEEEFPEFINITPDYFSKLLKVNKVNL